VVAISRRARRRKAERARLHQGRAHKANEAMFAAPGLIAKTFDRLAEATMRLAEATHLEKLARPCDFATWAKAEKKRRGMVRRRIRSSGKARGQWKPPLITASASNAPLAFHAL
jgi:hypothetical protein